MWDFLCWIFVILSFCSRLEIWSQSYVRSNRTSAERRQVEGSWSPCVEEETKTAFEVFFLGRSTHIRKPAAVRWTSSAFRGAWSWQTFLIFWHAYDEDSISPVYWVSGTQWVSVWKWIYTFHIIKCIFCLPRRTMADSYPWNTTQW